MYDFLSLYHISLTALYSTSFGYVLLLVHPKVTLDVLSYQSCASAEDAAQLASEPVAEVDSLRLSSFDSPLAGISDRETLLGTLSMFMAMGESSRIVGGDGALEPHRLI